MSRMSSVLVHVAPKVTHRNRTFTLVTVFADARCPAQSASRSVVTTS